jgi:hypothetical protein
MRALAATAVVLLLAGCATPAGPASPDGSGASIHPPAAATGEVIGQGTVMQVGEDSAEFCLGAIMESYPPQCSGPEIIGWDWAAAEMSENSGSVTWGSYALQGTWDGVAFTTTQPPIPLALYDPMALVDPRTQPENKGNGSENDLQALQQELHAENLPGVLGSWPENGYLFLSVVYDDGSLQDALDALYGTDVIAVQSALRPVG